MHESHARTSRFSFDTAATWLLGATAFLSVVAFIPFGNVSFFGTKVSIIAIGAVLAFIAYVIARLLRGSLVVPPMSLLGAVWLLPVAYLLSALFSGTALLPALLGIEIEVDTFGFVLTLALLSTLAALALRRDRDYQVFFGSLGAGIALALVFQVGVFIAARFIPTLAPTGNLVGTFADLGMVAGLGVVLSLVALRTLALGKRIRTVAWIGLVIALFILVLVNSALLWVSVGLVALALFIETLLRRRKGGMDDDLEGAQTLHEEATSEHTGGAFGAAVVTLLAGVFFLVAGGTVGGAIGSVLGVNTIDVRPSWQSTFLIGSHTYASSPLFGSGPATFDEQWLKFRDRSLNDSIFWNIDFASGIGYIPTSFVTTGIVGVIAWLALLGFFLYAGARLLLFRLPSDSTLRFAALASFVGAAYALVVAFFSVPGPVLLALGFLLLGVFVSTIRHGKERSEWGIVFSKSPRIGFAVVFLLTLLLLAAIAAAYLVVERYLASAYLGQANAALSAGDLDRAEAALSRSATFHPSERVFQLAAASGVERMRRIANDSSLSQASAQQQFQTALTAAVNSGLEAVRVGPNNYQNWNVLGSVYQSVAVLDVAGAYQGAKEAYDRAIALNPTSPAIPFVIAQLEIAEGNTAAAEERLLSSINLKRDYIPSILLLSQLEIQLGKASEALQAAEAAAYFAPNDPAVLFQVGLLRSGTGDYAGAVTALARAVELNPQYANARFFLAAMYARQGETELALAELRTIAGYSEQNATAVAEDIAALERGENPFPLTRLRTLGIPQPPVQEPEDAPVE